MTQPIANDSNLNKIVDTIGELPASPAIVSAVMGLTSNLNSKVTDVSKVLASDQSLTAKVLKLSNSSFYGRSKEVKTLQKAILILGFFTVRSMVIATSAHSMFSKGGQDGPEVQLWRHSLSTAVAARQIAKHLCHPEQQEVFIAALLHDIGKLVLIQRLPDQYQQVLTEVEGTAGEFIEVETRLLGFNHCDVASLLLEKWFFPSNLCEAILTHHHPKNSEAGRPASLAELIYLGNHMAKRLEVGFNDRRIENLAETDTASDLRLDEATLDDIYGQVAEHYTAEIGIFEDM